MDNYIVRNKDYITSHKLKEFIRCPFCFKKKHIDLVPSPRQETPEYFVVGQAFDDYMTYGEGMYTNKYEVVARRGGESDKQQLTKLQGDTINALVRAYGINPFFSPSIKKKVLEGEIFDIKVRGELDHFIEDENIIVDIKTTANLAKFDPMSYVYQMSFYCLLIEELEGKKCTARLYVCEKDVDIPKSLCFEFTQETLMEGRRTVLQDIIRYKEAIGNDHFPQTNDQYTLLTTCEYYGVDGHGIQQNIITL